MEISAPGYIAALDVGDRRIGVALAHSTAALPAPYTTLINNDQIWAELSQLVQKEQVVSFVVGLPRGLSGEETTQTAVTRQFVEELKKHFSLPVYLQDEAGTSLKAEAQLQARGKGYNKEMVDAWAATIILEDFLRGREVISG